MQPTERNAKLEAQMSNLAGYNVELTVRGERSFTFSFEEADAAAGQRIADFFKGYKTEVDVDAECGTCVYLDA